MSASVNGTTAPPADKQALFHPTPGLSYCPHDEQYYDPEALLGELRRGFDLCHSCRLCFKYCQSFPTLFSAIDNNNGEVDSLPESVTRQVVDECFGCKLCYTNCPYTPAEQHPFQLDFPALMIRARAQRVKQEGLPLRDKLLADPDTLGQQGTLLPILANGVNQNSLFRTLMEKAFGIHREKQLPEFHSPTFREWFERHTDGQGESPTGEHRMVLFHTCFVDYNAPAIGRDAVEVLEHNHCKVSCPQVNCCGMPALDSGDIDFAIEQAKRNVAALLPFVEQGYRIAVINPTCSLMLRQEYPVLLANPAEPAYADAAKKVAEATRDLGEFLFQLRQAGHFQEDFRSTPAGTIAYHVPCHLKKQNIGFRSRDMLRRIPRVRLQLVDHCSGHDGTWSMKTEYFELSLKNGKAAFEELQESEATLWTSDCPLAAMHIEQATGRRPLHPIQVLARVYRPDGFEHTLPAPIPPTPAEITPPSPSHS